MKSKELKERKHSSQDTVGEAHQYRVLCVVCVYVCVWGMCVGGMYVCVCARERESERERQRERVSERQSSWMRG
jgi:hypothetical protein